VTDPIATAQAGTDPMDFDDLVTAATVGVDRLSLPLVTLAGPAAAHAGVLDSSDPAVALLDAAALLSSARRAALLPAALGRTAAPAPPDTAPELSPGASRVLGSFLRASDPILVADLLRATAEAGFRVAAPMLPALLDVAARDRSLRPPARAVLGGRGQWLAAHRPEWRRVTDSDDTDSDGTDQVAAAPGGGTAADPATSGGPEASGDPGVWQTGRPGERRAWLAGLRRRVPGQARELLAAGWSREAVADRDKLLEILGTHLSAADEPFLEAALDDRKAAVRQVAARLLAAIPAAAFRARAVTRGAGLLRVEQHPAAARSPAERSAVLAVTLPESVDTAAARDGIGAVPPSPAIGARAWLLTQFIAAVPLAEWTSRLGRSPAELAALPVLGGFQADVHAGWRLAAVAQRDAAWTAALLVADEQADPARPPAAWPPPEELAAVLPAAARMARAQGLLTRYGPTPQTAAALVETAGPWTEGLADTVLRQFAFAAGAGRPPRWTNLLYPLAARKLPVEGHRDHAAELRGLAAAALDNSLAVGLRRAADIVDRRRYFLQELQ
jgi:hypothetical protein